MDMTTFRELTESLGQRLLALGYREDRDQSDAKHAVFFRDRGQDLGFGEVWLADAYDSSGFMVHVRFGVRMPDFLLSYSGIGPDDACYGEVMSGVFDRVGFHRWRPSRVDAFRYGLGQSDSASSLLADVGRSQHLDGVEQILRARMVEASTPIAPSRGWLGRLGWGRRQAEEPGIDERIRRNGDICALAKLLLSRKQLAEGARLMRLYVERSPGWKEREKVLRGLTLLEQETR